MNLIIFKKIFCNFCRVFGIPLLLQETSPEKLTDFLLEETMMFKGYTTPNDDLTISSEDMRKYIKYASNVNVEMPLVCAELLRNYFIASRFERPGKFLDMYGCRYNRIVTLFIKLLVCLWSETVISFVLLSCSAV